MTATTDAPAPLQPVDEETFVRMLRYALVTGGERLHFRPGARPLQQGIGADRELRYRQLTGQDTSEIAGYILAHAIVPQRLKGDTCDAARPLYLFYELPGEALIEAQMESAPGGIALHLDVIRPMPHAHDVEVIEP